MSPPKKFRSAGIVTEAHFSSSTPGFAAKRKRAKGARAGGLAYEKKAHRKLLEEFPEYYVASPWLQYYSQGVHVAQWCQPDGLVIDTKSGLIVIIEMKLQHTTDAYWQLKWKYLPVLMRIFSPDRWEFRLCEMVKWFDCKIQMPEKQHLRPHPFAVEENEIGVFIWNPQRPRA